MTDTLRNMPRYIRQTDAFGWQGADSANGPWRSIPPPQSGMIWQTTSPMDDLRQASADVSGVTVLSDAALIILDRFRAIVAAKGTERLALATALRAAASKCAGLPDGRDCTNLLIKVATELERDND